MPALTAEPLAGVDTTLEAVAAYGLAGSRRAMPTQPLDRSAWHAFIAGVARERLAGLLGSAILDGALPVSDEQLEEAAACRPRSRPRHCFSNDCC